MDLIGVLIFGKGQCWGCNGEEAWTCPLEVGDWVEVLVGGEWQAVTMWSGGYYGRYFCGADGRWMRVRLAVC